MNITYTGIRGNTNWPWVRKGQNRLATICYDEESVDDCRMANRVVSVLATKGYKIPKTNVGGSFEIVVADKAEYQQLVADYKTAKEIAKLLMTI